MTKCADCDYIRNGDECGGGPIPAGIKFTHDHSGDAVRTTHIAVRPKIDPTWDQCAIPRIIELLEALNGDEP